MIVNIPRTITDPNYRYQMPLLQQVIEGKGINIRTNLINLSEVAKSLRVMPMYILKFMGYELGSQVNEKRNVCTINGELNHDDILKTLDKFIEKYVLCSNCGLPEMPLKVENNRLACKCNSCGAITAPDMKHKLSSYIIKNPPELTGEFGPEAQKQVETVGRDFSDVDRKKYEIRRKIAASSFEPLEEASQPVFQAIEEYLSLILPINDKYFYNSSQPEVVYKAVKRLRMENKHFDRIGYILFNHIFDKGILKQVETRGVLFEEVLKRHKMEELIPVEIILNLQVFLYVRFDSDNWAKQIPTILKNFNDQEIISVVRLEGSL